MINDEAEELFQSLKSTYQNNLESLKGSNFVFDYVHLFHYKSHKINPNCDGSCIDSPDWISIKKATINPIDKRDNKCFQCTLTVTLNHGEIGKNPERITKIKPFINEYKWEGINFLSEKDDWEKFEKNKVAIALNASYAKIYIYPAYVSKNTSSRERQVITLMIPNWEGPEATSKELISIIKKNNV